MHKARSSAGLSLDIPLIMLAASLLKIFYWPGARFDASLLVQALTMVAVQLVLLKVALDNRAGWRGDMGLREDRTRRLGGFWRWRAQKM